ncbi:MAG: hypothetical protein WA294_14665 [Acidobacteriaceae bacterium]
MKRAKAQGICPDSLPATELALTANCEEVMQSMRFLTGAITCCGAEVLTRGFDAEGHAAMEMEFSRSLCVEIYCMLIATGLELDCDSHLRLTALCQCTRELPAEKRQEAVRCLLRLRDAATGERRDSREPCAWLLRNACQQTYEA